MEPIVYLNGQLMPLSAAKISPMDYGFLYGYGVFETMRAYQGRVFRLGEHLARLRSSADELNIDLDRIPEIAAAVDGTLRANSLFEARVRISLSPGEEPADNRFSATLFIRAVSYAPPPEEAYSRGWTAAVSRVRRSPRSPAARLKSLSALDTMIARQEAANAGADHAILLNDDGLVAEGSSSNIFHLSEGTLFTPAGHAGLLPGVTRRVVLSELAPALGIPAREADISLDDLLRSEEVFITNSMIEIMPVTTVAGRTIGTGRPGHLTQRLMRAYKTLTGGFGGDGKEG